jgi:16S rRNA (cytidine1402-2'-O)-methyltransferase
MDSGVQPRGKLFLVPAPLDFGCAAQVPLRDILPPATIAVAAGLRHWICENAKSTRAYLKRIDSLQALSMPLRELNIQELPREVHKKGDHHGEFDARPLLAPALAGNDIGLVSEAGMPAVADPGSSVVRAAHDLDIAVEPLVGPASLLLALAASGLNGQSFAFVGYLPQGGPERTQRIRELETLARRTGQTQLFIETPYRNAALLAALLETLRDDTRLAVSSGLTLPQARNRSAAIGKWRHDTWTLDGDTPVVFALGR